MYGITTTNIKRFIRPLLLCVALVVVQFSYNNVSLSSSPPDKSVLLTRSIRNHTEQIPSFLPKSLPLSSSFQNIQQQQQEEKQSENYKFPNVILPDPNPNKAYRWNHKHDFEKNPSWVWVEKNSDDNLNSIIPQNHKMVIPSPLCIHNHTQWGLDSIISTTTTTAPATSSSSGGSSSSSSAPPKSVVFYGSSHIREFYFTLIRLKRGIAYNAQLETAVKKVGFHMIHPELCKKGNNPLPNAGIDLEHCGYLENRLVPELGGGNDTMIGASNNVAIGYKTFLHTPDSEQHFVDFLLGHGLRHPFVLVVDVGLWGPRLGRTYAKSNTTNEPMKHWRPEVDYYMDWVVTTFPTSHVVYVYEDTPYGYFADMYAYILHRLLLQHKNTTNNHLFLSRPSSLIIRKDLIMKKLPSEMPCNHGCAGPVVQVVARYFLGWLQDLVKFESLILERSTL